MSNLLVEIFAETVGRHSRSAAGMAELPLDIPVEIEVTVPVLIALDSRGRPATAFSRRS